MGKLKASLPEDFDCTDPQEPCYDGVTVEDIQRELSSDPGYNKFLNDLEEEDE